MLGFPALLFAQIPASKMQITSIEVEGNKKTKTQVILRELNFAVGDSLAIDEKTSNFELNRLNLMNTNLFRSVTISMSDSSTQQAKILIKVVEPLYIWTGWFVELADRNFNVWWKEENFNLRRINVALTPLWRNITGRRDYLKGIVQLGYTQKGELEYALPEFDKKHQFGLQANIYFTRAREVAYATEKNKLKFHFDEDRFQLRKLRLFGGFSYRPRLQSTHRFRVQYDRTNIDGFVSDSLNPNFLGNGIAKQTFVTLEYHYVFDRRDIRPYPEKGTFASFTLKKEGLSSKSDLNTLYATATYAKYIRYKKWSLENILKVRKELLGQSVPYYNTRGLGYQEDYIRGYEYYVIDGVDFGYLKTTLRYKLFERKLNFRKYVPIERFKNRLPLLPMRSYFTIHSDLGYVRNLNAAPTNNLLNKTLWGNGVGFVTVFNYDDVIEIDLSHNQLGQWATFLHFKTPLR